MPKAASDDSNSSAERGDGAAAADLTEAHAAQDADHAVALRRLGEQVETLRTQLAATTQARETEVSQLREQVATLTSTLKPEVSELREQMAELAAAVKPVAALALEVFPLAQEAVEAARPAVEPSGPEAEQREVRQTL